MIHIIDVIGRSNTFSLIIAALQKATVPSPKWPQVEACLCALGVLSEGISRDNAAVIPLLQFLAQIPPNLVLVLVARNNLLKGDICTPINSNQELLRAIIAQLQSNLSASFAPLVKSAAAAISEIFKNCPNITSVCDIGSIYSQLCSLRVAAPDVLSLESEKLILQGFSHILNQLDDNNCASMLERMTGPLLNALSLQSKTPSPCMLLFFLYNLLNKIFPTSPQIDRC